MSALGEPLIVPVTIPCSVEVVPRGHQNRKGHIVWDKGAIAIEKVDAAEAPVAFRVVAQAADRRDYEIRRFRGRLWWPLFEAGAPMRTTSFVASASRTDGCFLSSLNLSPSTLAAPRDANGFELPWFIGKIEADSRAERWVQANRSAVKLLSCEGIMYAEGGTPAYFAVRKSALAPLEFRIGQMEVGPSFPGDRWHVGPDKSRRQSAVIRSDVFAPSTWSNSAIDEAVAKHGRQDSERLVMNEQGASSLDLTSYSAHVLAEMIMRRASAAPGLSAAILPLGLRDRKTDWFRIENSREILWVALNWVDIEHSRFFGVSADRLRKMIASIDRASPPPSLCPEDDLGLAKMDDFAPA